MNYLRCLGLDGFDFGLCLAETLPFGEPGDFFDFGDCSVEKKMKKKNLTQVQICEIKENCVEKNG